MWSIQRLLQLTSLVSYELNLRGIAEEIVADILNTTARMSRLSILRFRRQGDVMRAGRSKNEEKFQAKLCAGTKYQTVYSKHAEQCANNTRKHGIRKRQAPAIYREPAKAS